MENKNLAENPLKTIAPNGGFCGIFKTIACIGDSLASGEFESKKEDGKISYHDWYEYSWGQCIARHTGSKVYNFSRGGMTAKEYMEGFAESRGFWDGDKKCQAYIIALGVNDLLNCGQEVGNIGDINREDYTQNAPTFAGYYAQIIQRLKMIQPRARFFLVTMLPGGRWKDEGDAKKKAHRDLMEALCLYFDNTYLIDLFTFGPNCDETFYETYFLGGHMSPMGYLYMGQLIESYIDPIIRKNPRAFADVCYIGTDFTR